MRNSDLQLFLSNPKEWGSQEFYIQTQIVNLKAFNRMDAVNTIINTIWTHQGGTLEALKWGLRLRDMKNDAHPAAALRQSR